ncbi:spore germination protein [Paenibacillus aestuarii]|uniref:Spore germination protein n=1 Tax=Paenibacillus aestuarii TaxID=516965 RepID=A0ABW0K0P1_9BACL|nr:spore germination protein [Paenibacillus aestuarii]
MKRLLQSGFRHPSASDEAPESLQVQQVSLTAVLADNLQRMHAIYNNCPDVVFRPLYIDGSVQATLIYIEGLSNNEAIDKSVIAPLAQIGTLPAEGIHTVIEQQVTVPKINELHTIADCVEQLSSGCPVLLMENNAVGLSFNLAKWEKRGVEEPTAEAVVRGPREGFTESLGVNTSLLRRRLRTPQLKMLQLRVGRYTQTELVVAFIDEIAEQGLIEEVLKRLKRIDIDGVMDSAYIEELIEDAPHSLFPQIMNTERPDVAAANLLEGRVVILVDGTPSVLIAPVTFYSLLQSAEDYYQRYSFSTAIRWLRYAALVISLLLPSLYVATLTYHQEMIPTSLFFSIAKSREEIPFPVVIEALIMEITFEALREAGVRLPKQIGAAVSIVGALVIGQAAVSAGIVSAPMVMVVAITGISSFMIPRYSAGISIRLLRFPIILLAGVLGLLGIMLSVIFTVVHLCTIRSFGVPYMSPMGPMKGRDMKDVLIRAPLWMLNTRPHLTGDGNKYRQAPDQKPDANRGDD